MPLTCVHGYDEITLYKYRHDIYIHGRPTCTHTDMYTTIVYNSLYMCILGRTDLLVNPFLFFFRRPRRDNCPVSHSKGPHDLCPFGVGEATCPMQGFLEALHDRVRQNKTWFNMAYHHFFFCHPFWIIGCCNNLVAQTSQASLLLVEACFKQLPVNWQKPLLRSKTAELFVSPKALILLFWWIFWVCILGFSIALISNVARILIHKWTVEAAWQLKIPAGFWALAFPSCFEICFDLALSILFVHVSKVHDLDSLNDPLIEHVLLDTGSRPWKRPYATFTPRTRHDVTSDWWWMALHESWATITFTFLLALLGCKRAQSWAIFSCVLQSYIGLPGSWSAWPA